MGSQRGRGQKRTARNYRVVAPAVTPATTLPADLFGGIVCADNRTGSAAPTSRGFCGRHHSTVRFLRSRDDLPPTLAPGTRPRRRWDAARARVWTGVVRRSRSRHERGLQQGAVQGAVPADRLEDRAARPLHDARHRCRARSCVLRRVPRLEGAQQRRQRDLHGYRRLGRREDSRWLRATASRRSRRWWRSRRGSGWCSG
jgi:hypothetical protein